MASFSGLGTGQWLHQAVGCWGEPKPQCWGKASGAKGCCVSCLRMQSLRNTKMRDFKKERRWLREYCMSSASAEQWKKSCAGPRRTSERIPCVRVELRHVPPASTQGAQMGAGGNVGTHSSTLQEGVLPHTPQHPKLLYSPQNRGKSRPRGSGSVPQAPQHAAAETNCWGLAAPGVPPNSPPPSCHLLSFPASPSPPPAAAHPDTHQDEGLFLFH